MSGTPIEEIKAKIDIVEFLKGYMELRSAGRNFKACCPFHKEKSPSFMVSPDRQIWHCFGCGEGGDIFKFVMKYENLEFYEALKLLAEKAGVELKKVSPSDQKEFGVLYDLNREAADFYRNTLKKTPAVNEYLSGRGLLSETVDLFEIGFAPQNWEDLTLYLVDKGFDMPDIVRSGLSIKTERGTVIDRFRGRVMFPLESSFGKVVGFSGRILPAFDNGETAKYMNSPETPIFSKSRILFGLSRAKEGIREVGSALLVEGQMDVIMCHQDGVKNAVGTSGTALTDDQLVTLKRYTSKLIMNFDNDEAGRMAMERSIDLAYAKDFEVSVLDFSKCSDEVKGMKDPADIAKASPGEMKKLVDYSINAMEYYFIRYPVSVEEITERKGNIRAVIKKIGNIPSAVERGYWLKELAFRSRSRESEIMEEMRVLSLKDVRRPSVENLSGPSVSVGRKVKKTKIELIADRIVALVVGSGGKEDILGDKKDYLPESALRLYNGAVFGVPPDDNDIEGLLTDIALRSGLSREEVSEEDGNELEDLINNLEMEYLLERREALSERVRSGRLEEEEERNALLEHQDISKKIEMVKNNKKNG
ncbi:MAG: DNA primase [Candidatus Colwellbacteria bacterium]|nr:DNA primase [Candidatus Colwellbacteria bacterium]